MRAETPTAETDSPRSSKEKVSAEVGAASAEEPATNDADAEAVDEVESSGDTESLDLKPYSLPSVRELFRVLVNFLDPHDRQHTDTMRVMALRIIHVALEVSGSFIARHPALATIAEDRLELYKQHGLLKLRKVS